MEYENSQSFSGNTGRVMDLAVQVLTTSGFRILSRTDSMLEVEGPGMVSTRQRGMSGVSRASLRITGGSISLTAEFDKLKKFSRLFAGLLLGVCLLLVIILNALLPVMHWNRPV